MQRLIKKLLLEANPRRWSSERLYWSISTRLGSLLGSPVRCPKCRHKMANVLSFVWRGRLYVRGINRHLVRAEFDLSNRLVFRCLYEGACPHEKKS